MISLTNNGRINNKIMRTLYLRYKTFFNNYQLDINVTRNLDNVELDESKTILCKYYKITYRWNPTFNRMERHLQMVS